MLRSTTLSCPHLSICLIQCWYPLLSSLMSSTKGQAVLLYPLTRDLMCSLTECLMCALKRIWVTKSFEITQVKVIIQCMVRLVKLLSEVIDNGIDEVIDEYFYCSNIVFWVCVSWVQTAILSSANRSVRHVVGIGLGQLVSLLGDKRFKEFFWETKRFSRNFEGYSVFVEGRKEFRNSNFSNQNEFEGNYLWLYDLIFKCITESGKVGALIF